MSFKTIFIIATTALLTLILANNTDEIDFWIFGNAQVPKLAVMGAMFVLGLLLGYLTGKPVKKEIIYQDESAQLPEADEPQPRRNTLSDEDREYIS